MNVSSTAAHRPLPLQAAHGASKAAVELLTRAWGVELGAQGIRVNAVSPGPTETEGVARLPFPPEVFEQISRRVIRSRPEEQFLLRSRPDLFGRIPRCQK